MAAQTSLLPIIGAFSMAWIIPTTGLCAVFLITLVGILVLKLNNSQVQSPLRIRLQPNVKLPTTSREDGLQAKGKPSRRYQSCRISNIPISIAQDTFREVLLEAGADDLLGFSCAPAATSTLASKYHVATVTFADAPDIIQLQKALRIRLGRHASLLRVDSDFFGLTPLNSPPQVQSTKVDIIAVVGLAGHGFGTWKAKGRPNMWLRDFLPETIPGARIMTYGYDTELPGSQSETSVVELSRNLLESIKTSRDETSKDRPLILIGHSLGGLVVKHALVLAFEGSVEDKAVFRSCFALLLFGVPNRGMDNASLMAMVKGQPNEAIVRELSPSSRFLSELHRQFSKIFTLVDSTIISWYETKGTATIEYSEETGSFEKTNKFRMLVEHTSATHAGPNEKNYDQLGIDADHSEIVKFDDPSNQYYVVVADRVRKLVALGPEILAKRLSERQKRLSEREREYIRLLQSPDYAACRKYKIADPAPNTLGWFLDKSEFLSWERGPKSSLLWVKGSAGQGKTILAKFLVNHLEDAIATAKAKGIIVIYFFFYEQDDSLRTIGSVLRALIRQLLSSGVDTFSVISDEVDLDGSQIDEVGLWGTLERLLMSPVLEKVFCVIDALDELPDTKLRHELITFFQKLAAPSGTRTTASPVLKFLLVSRPTIDIDRQLNKYPSIGLVANPHDLQAFVHYELAFLRDQRDDGQHAMAVRMLIGRTEQTFLWISLVARRLKAAAMLTMAEIKNIISESPSDLDRFYDSIVTEIMGRDGDIPKKLLLWAVYWRRPLTLAELEEAISVQHDSESIASTAEYRLPLDKNKNNLSGAIGVIVNISDDNKVHLTHQSVKEFLVNSSHLAAAEFCRGLQPNLYLAQICMLFLCFPDAEADQAHDGRMGFLRYAAYNWHHHVESDLDNKSRLDELIARVTQPKSAALLRWARVAGLSASIQDAKGPWDVAMEAHIDWLGEIEFKAAKTTIGHEQVDEVARKGTLAHGPFLRLVQSTGVKFTDAAVCSMVKVFDQSILRAYYDSHGTLPKTQAVYVAAAQNKEYALPMLRWLLDVWKGEENRKLVVSTYFAQSLIRYSANWKSENPSKYAKRSALSVLVKLLVHSEAVHFTSQGWAELLLCQEPIDPILVYHALESRQDCSWIETFLAIVSTSLNDYYYDYCNGSSSYNKHLPMEDLERYIWRERYPNIQDATMSRIFRECHGLGGVVDDKVTSWAGQWLGPEGFGAFTDIIFPLLCDIKDVLMQAVLAGNADLVFFLITTRGDEIRGSEQCVFYLACGPAVNNNQDDDDILYEENCELEEDGEAKEDKQEKGEDDDEALRWLKMEDRLMKKEPMSIIESIELRKTEWASRYDGPLEAISPYVDRWKKYRGNYCLWYLLVAGGGSKVALSDRLVRKARSAGSVRLPEVADILDRMRSEDTDIEIESRHLIQLLEPPLGRKRDYLKGAAIATSFQNCAHDAHLPEELGIQVALHNEIELLALVLEHWPDTISITTEFLEAAVSVIDFDYKLLKPTYSEDDSFKDKSRAKKLMKLLLGSRREEIGNAFCIEVGRAAAACGNSTIIRLLCTEERLFPRKKEWREIIRVREAISSQDVEALGSLLQDQVLSDTADYWGITPLALATLQLNMEMVRMLLDSGAVDIDKRDRDGRTAIFWTARHISLPAEAYASNYIFISLFEAGAQMDIVDHNGMTLSRWASAQGAVKISEIVGEASQWQKEGKDPEGLAKIAKMMEELQESPNIDKRVRDCEWMTNYRTADYDAYDYDMTRYLQTDFLSL